jgi:DNA repair exonuclease SbcCD ATPase subunit
MTNEMLPGLFEGDLPQEHQVDEFRYEVLDPEDREFVQEKEYEVRTHWTRAASEIMASGEKLLLVQDRLKKANNRKHGSFAGWLKKVGLSEGNAFFAMKAFNKFGNNKNSVLQSFSSEVVRELTYASDEIVDQVVSGDVHPTVKAIREAKKAEKEAKEAEAKAKADAIKAKADARAAQQQLTLKEASFQSEFDTLKEQFEAKIKRLEAITDPQIEIREVEKEVLPQSVKNNIEEMQEEIDKLNANLEALNTDLETAKGTVPQEIENQIKDLQTQLTTYKTLIDTKEKSLEEIRNYNAKIAETNKRLSEEARLMSAETQASVGRARIRQKWRKDTTDLHVSIAKFVAEMPSMIDQESLEGDDWARQAQCVDILQRALSAIRQMRNNQSDPFVNASVDDTPFSYNGTGIVDAEAVRW